jgi:hypothetical protein
MIGHQQPRRLRGAHVLRKQELEDIAAGQDNEQA